MLLTVGATLLLQLSAVLACPDHSNRYSHPHRGKRQVTTNPGRNVTDWAYEASYDWGRINPAYQLCQAGTQQSPIPLGLEQGLSHRHNLTFNYRANVTGNFYNWGYGPAFSLEHKGEDYSTLASSATVDNETVYLKGWHIHTPADHSVGGVHSHAELHFVHVNRAGSYRAVVAFRIDPGPSTSAFFSQLPPYLGFNDTRQIEGLSINNLLAINEVQGFAEYWTYKGSLTSPPCTEGVQWFVARQILFVNNNQMQAILRASTYSQRAEQAVWMHEINV